MASISSATPAAEPEPTLYIKSLLNESASWTGERISGNYDIERVLKLNSAMNFAQNGRDLAFCLIASHANQFLASFSVDHGGIDIIVTVYRTHANSLDEEWKSTAAMQAPFVDRFSLGRATMSLHGWISCDGKRVLIEYRADYGESRWLATSDQGQNWIPLRMHLLHYSSHGIVSADDKYLFFVRSGGGFGGGGQGEIVDVYSTTSWSHVRSWTFSFGNGYQMQNVSMLQGLAIERPVFCAISASPSRECIIAASNGTQFPVDIIEQSSAGERTWVSSDGRHLVYLSRDDGKMHYWDLRNPTYKPIKTTKLPDVEATQTLIHIINGREVPVGTAIPKQSICCRFSPRNEVVTVIVGNDLNVTVLSFLTFNLQLVYKRTEPFSVCPGHTVLQIRIGEERGVSILGGTPFSGGYDSLKGLAATFAVMTGVYEDIIAVEKHFDSAEATIRALDMAIPKAQPGVDQILYGWQISASAVDKAVGQARALTADEREHQLKLYNSIFLKDRFTTFGPTPAVIQERVFHMFTFQYPWDRKGKVYVFAIRMKYDYSVVAMAVTKQTTSEPYILRVLYTSENLHASNPERVDILQHGLHYVLRVAASSDGAYSGIPLPSSRLTVIGHQFLPHDASYDIFIIKESTSTTFPSGGITSPNVSLVFTATFAAYLPSGYMRSGQELDYGHRSRNSYVMPKFDLWLGYSQRSRRNEPFFGGGELMDHISDTFDAIFDDRFYDDTNTIFPSAFATAATIDIRSNQTVFVDEFLKKYHQSDALILANSHAISHSLPLVCRARPAGVLSLMRHVALFKFKLGENIAVLVSTRAHERKRGRLWRPKNKILALFYEIFLLFKNLLLHWFLTHPKRILKANTTAVTIPLDGFCTYDRHIYHVPPSYRGFRNEPFEHFYDMVNAVYYTGVGAGAPRRFPRINNASGRRRHPSRTSPFTSLVESLFNIDDHEMQFSIIKVIWFEKLVYWKLQTFGQRIFLTRVVLPLVVNLGLQLALSLLTAGGESSIVILVLGVVQAVICAYLVFQKLRQAGATSLFFRSVFNFLDIIAIALSVTNASMVLARYTPPRPFVAYTMAILWIDIVLAARMYEKAGVLMILLTEMLKGVMPFLTLLAFFIVGVTFIPYLLLRNEGASDVDNPFRDFGKSLAEMITFMSNDFNSLDPFKGTLVSIQVLRAVFTVLVSILFLNSLIALLNLRVEAADKRSRNIWIRQMAATMVEIEKGILTNNERNNPYWFPRWYTYHITEPERHDWQSYVNKHPLNLGYGPDDGETGRRPTAPVAGRTQGLTTTRSEAATPTSATPAPASQPAATTAQTAGAATTSAQAVQTPPNQATSSSPSTGTLAPPSTTPANNPFAAPASVTTQLRPTSPVKTTQPSTTTPSTPATSPSPSRSKVSRSTPPVPPAAPSALNSNVPVPSTADRESLFTGPTTLHKISSDNPGVTGSGNEAGVQNCRVCQAAGTKQCTGCRKVRYCSAGHQRQDWATHKKDCAGKAKVSEP